MVAAPALVGYTRQRGVQSAHGSQPGSTSRPSMRMVGELGKQTANPAASSGTSTRVIGALIAYFRHDFAEQSLGVLGFGQRPNHSYSISIAVSHDSEGLGTLQTRDRRVMRPVSPHRQRE